MRHHLRLVPQQDGAVGGDRLDERPPGEEILGDLRFDDDWPEHLEALERGRRCLGPPHLVLASGRGMLGSLREFDLPECAKVLDPGLDVPDTDTYARTYVQGRPAITTVTATEARKQLYKLLDDVSNSHEPVQITGKRGNAVLVGEDDWRAVQETLYLVSIPGMRESIIEGIGTPVEELDGELRW